MSEHAATPRFEVPGIRFFREATRSVTGYWWVLLVAGIAWVAVSLVILQFDQASVTTVGVIIGVMFFATGLQQFVVGALVERGVDVRIFGPWRRKLAKDSPLRPRLEHGFFSPQRMAEIFAASKATLNIHTWRGKFDYGLNPRVFEAAACGVPQLVDWKRELDELFDEKERAAMLVYRSDEELLAKCRALPAELRERAVAASATIRERHSYLARMRELLRMGGK